MCADATCQDVTRCEIVPYPYFASDSTCSWVLYLVGTDGVVGRLEYEESKMHGHVVVSIHYIHARDDCFGIKRNPLRFFSYAITLLWR